MSQSIKPSSHFPPGKKREVDLTPDEWKAAWKAAMSASRTVSPAGQKSPIASRPGDLVHAIFTAVGIEANPGCGCAEMQAKMNEWGYAGCWKHRKELIAWFAAKAMAEGKTISKAAVMKIVVTAWRKSKGRKSK